MTQEIIPTVSAGQLGGYGIAALTLIVVWMKFNSFEKAFAERLKQIIHASDQPEKRELSPQPFVVKKEEEYTPRSSFHKHAELNREEHAKLHKRIDDLIKDIGDVRCEVSAVNATLEANGVRLVQMDQKIDRILERRNQ